MKILAKRIMQALIIILVLCIFPVGCGSEETLQGTQGKDEEKKIQIGVTFDSFVIERWQRDRDVFVSMAKELGADVNIQNANGDVAEQKKQIEYFIKKKMDVIVIVCIDSQALKTNIKKAKDAGVKVIAYDRLISDSDVDLYISFDNEKVGELMGQALVDNGLVGGKVTMINGSPKDNNVPMVCDGFKSVMEENGNEIVDSYYCDGWKAELAGEYMYKNMDVVSECDAIMCGNDDLASRVVTALSEKRLAGKIMVVGQDADLEACQRIVEGTQLMTVYKPIEKLAQRAAECAVNLAKEEQIGTGENDLSTISDGTYSIPYLKIDPVSVTKENMDEVIINSGFHLKEDVYLNVPSQIEE
ncbi:MULTISPECIES: sugar ABC transporter substrate-binding protein [unclassified Butyrivibrio]|uniref:sugar ABC transporter substrate-binding protein n=1 Tax=unclassified Butyrivibrio TaxID=2639466 RepID=UPI0004248F2D|nr:MULTISPECIES: substrate-binding domain-containing protein [unclassified Butyrivibrio]